MSKYRGLPAIKMRQSCDIRSLTRKRDRFTVCRQNKRLPDKIRRFRVAVEVPNWIINDAKTDFAPAIFREALRRIENTVECMDGMSTTPAHLIVYHVRVSIDQTSVSAFSKNETQIFFDVACEVTGGDPELINTNTQMVPVLRIKDKKKPLIMNH